MNATTKRYDELKRTPYFVIRQLQPGNWRASTDKGYFHGKDEAEVRAKYEAAEGGAEEYDRTHPKKGRR